MTRKATMLVTAALALALAACASGKLTSAPDAGPGDDAASVDAATKGQFWDDCVDHADCESAICYYQNDDDATGHCTDECDGTCPDGFACQVVQISDFTDIRVCIPAEPNLCASCEANVDCGDSGDFCVEFTASKACSVDCSADPDGCPVGFTCQTVAGTGDTVVGQQCMPTNGICCLDADGDLRGVGSGCLGPDCDDDNDAVYDDAEEICDGFDNDCAGGIDVDFTDCVRAECWLDTAGYIERAAEPCTEGACIEQSEQPCGLYTCADGGEEGDACADACDGEVDSKCIPAAHCDASVCLDDLDDGASCDEHSDCVHAHCQGDGGAYCCPFGDCCQIPEDCPTFGTEDPVCDNPTTCQGTRGEAVCNANHTCGTTGTAQDDSACGLTTEANPCGYYLSVFCNGAEEQTAPACPSSCVSHADCDANGFCDPISHTCLEDRNSGVACGTDDATCKSGHCQNGFCCTSGDCCATKSDCPGSYTSDPECTVPTACQGEQDVGECLSFQCVTTAGHDNDSACGPATLASNCGLYPPQYCTGGTDQDAPSCAESCVSDLGCDSNAYCNLAGYCVPDGGSGAMCNELDGLGDAECASGHCQNGFCCTGTGDCCAANNDCLAYAIPAACFDPAGCQGHHTDGVCNTSNQCEGQLVEDDSICSGVEASACGLYPSVYCTAAAVQSAPTCSSSCTGDGGCDASAHCEAPVCVSDAQQGDGCDITDDCEAGLTCVDHICCATGCGGDCEACDLSPGGVCEPVGDGADPDDECDAVSCAAYYYGWVGSTCYRRADLDDAAMTCDGDGQCYTAATDCPTAGQGTAQVTCTGVCQSPNLSTCSGTTAGACNTGTPSTETTDDLGNGNFDAGPGAPWIDYSSGGYEIITDSFAHTITPLPSGTYAAFFGYLDELDEYIYQDVLIPAEATSIQVRGYRWIATDETTTVTQWDKVTVELRNPSTNELLVSLGTFSNLDATSSWVQWSSASLTSYAGQTVRLYIHSTTDISLPTSFYLDSFELRVTQPICL